jgi:hypothetical protein
VSTTGEELVEEGGILEGQARADESFLDPLVARLSAQYGLDPHVVRTVAVPVLASFAGARVRAFVPVLTEKVLRERCRGLSGRGPIPAAYDESMAGEG